MITWSPDGSDRALPDESHPDPNFRLAKAFSKPWDDLDGIGADHSETDEGEE